MPERRIATVLMLDVVGSTHIASQLGDVRFRELSSRFNRLVRASLRRFGGKEEDHAGDGFFATFPQPDRAIRCAATVADDVRELGLEIRSGIHTGQIEDQAGKAHGIAVVIGARVMSLADAGDILVTSTTKELVTGSTFGFEDFSAHELKGVPGSWQVFAVTAVDEEVRARPLPAAEAAERLSTIQPSTGREDRRPRVWIAAGAGLLVTIAAIAFAVSSDGGPPPPPPGDGSNAPSRGSVVQVDTTTGKIVRSIPVPVPTVSTPGVTLPTNPHSMIVGQGGVWTVRFRHLFHVDPSRSEIRKHLTIEAGISFSLNLTEGSGTIWLADDRGVIEVNPATDEQRRALLFEWGGQRLVSSDVVFGDGFVWVGSSEGRLVRFDPATGRDRFRTGLDPIDTIAFGHGSVWTVDAVGGTIARYDPRSMRRVAKIDVPTAADYLVSGDGAMWALSQGVGTLTRIDPATNDVRDQVQVGADPAGLTFGSGAVWVGDEDGILRGVDEGTRQVTEIPFGAEIRTIAYDDETDTLWVEVA
jgi:class 3 adenylate cyclase/streptogramin lyase